MSKLIKTLAFTFAFFMSAKTAVIFADNLPEFPIVRQSDNSIFVTGDAILNAEMSTFFRVESIQLSTSEILIELSQSADAYLAPLRANQIQLSFMNQFDPEVDGTPANLSLADVNWTATLSEAGHTLIHVPLDTLDLNFDRLSMLSIHNFTWDGPDFDESHLDQLFSAIVFVNEEDFNHFIDTRFVPLNPDDFESIEAFLIEREFGNDWSRHLIDQLQPLDLTFTEGDVTIELLSTLAIANPRSSGASTLTFVRVQGIDTFASESPEYWMASGRENILVYRELFMNEFGGFVNDAWASYVDAETQTAYFILRSWVPAEHVTDMALVGINFEEILTGFSTSNTIISGEELNLATAFANHQGQFTHNLNEASFSSSGGFWFGDAQEGWLADNGFEHPHELFEHFGRLEPGTLNQPLDEGVYLSNVALTGDVAHIQLRYSVELTQPLTAGRRLLATKHLDLRPLSWDSTPHLLLSHIDHIYQDEFTFDVIANFAFIINDLSDLANIELGIFTESYNDSTALNIPVSFNSPVVMEGAFTDNAHAFFVAGHEIVASHFTVDNFGISMQIENGIVLDRIINEQGLHHFDLGSDFVEVTIVFDDGSSMTFVPELVHFALGEPFIWIDEFGVEQSFTPASFLDLRSWSSELTGRTGRVAAVFINGEEVQFN